jgi:glutamate-1-semialdehyde aminotransferase
VRRELNRLGDRLREGTNQALKSRGVVGCVYCVYGASSIFRIFVGASAEELGIPTYVIDATRLDRGMGPLGGALHLAMLINGVDYSHAGGHGWMNGAMTDRDVDLVIDAFDARSKRLASARAEKRLG